MSWIHILSKVIKEYSLLTCILSKRILFLAKKSFSTMASTSAGLLKLTLLLKGLFYDYAVAVLLSLLFGYC